MMRYRNDNMLLRIAQGDAYGMAREYVKSSEHPEHVGQCLKFERYLAHPSYHKLPAGTYTDDTQMSSAIAEALIDSRAIAEVRGNCEESLSYEGFAGYFFQAFKRDPRDGYSREFQAILEEAKGVTHLRQLIIPNSTANGAAMRSVPIGVLSSPEQVCKIAAMQAMVTHATWGGINSAVSVALMSHFALYDRRDFKSMYHWCSNWSEAHQLFREPWVGPVQENSKDGKGLGVGMNTAWAVQTLLEEEISLMGILKRCILWGGDTDSVAAIAWGIASCRYQDEVLPEFFEADLEKLNGSKYGPEFLKDLGKRLMEAYA
jgi:ADP-ribosyl-[dinitrogen reductase] hydrolase